MKKVFVFILLFSFSFIFLCGCGPLSPAPEETIFLSSPPISSPEEATAMPTFTPSPSPSPTNDIVDEPTIIFPEDYENIVLQGKYMWFVNIPANLQNQGYRVYPYNITTSRSYPINQFINYPVNVIVDNDTHIYEEISYDVVHNRITDTLENKSYALLQSDGTFKTFSTEEELKTARNEISSIHNLESNTTISKELNGKLSGGIYDIEYKRGWDYAVISNTKSFAFVSQSLEYRNSIHSQSPDENYLQRKQTGPQVFALLDMETGNILKTYSLDMPPYLLNIEFSNDDKYVIIYFPITGGGNYLDSIALVIDIEASLAEKTPEE